MKYNDNTEICRSPSSYNRFFSKVMNSPIFTIITKLKFGRDLTESKELKSWKQELCKPPVNMKFPFLKHSLNLWVRLPHP